MSDKKNIDRLFQEKFKDFEVTPSSSVWQNITDKIDTNNSQRKAIPLWWKIAGVAAGLVLLFSIGNTVLNKSNVVPEEKVVNTNSDAQKTNQENSNLNDADNLNIIDDASNDTSNSELVQEENSNPEDILNNNSEKSNSVVKNNSENHTTLASTEKKPNTQKSNDLLYNNKVLKQEMNSTVAENTSDTDALQNRSDKENAIDEKLVNSVLEESNKSKNTDVAIHTNPKKEEIADDTSAVTNVSVDEEDGLSITEAIVAENEDSLDEDSNEKIGRWRVASNIAPVYFNTLGTGSSIHSQFNNNSKTGDVNMSYGISASYAINDKLSVRTGIHKVNLGYSTNDIVVYNNIQPIPNNNPLLRNISFNKESQDVSFISVDEFNFGQVPSVLSDRINASIDQKLGFLEIPLELQYNFTNNNNKFGISVIGGVSALFLSDNEIYSVQDGKTTLIGEATNVNNTSYSANLGLGLDYKVSKKINLNLEPIFKYQINTFNNTSGNFKPFFIGVYTGLSFKF